MKPFATLFIAAAVLTLGAWAFFTFGGAPSTQEDTSQDAVLKIQDPRLSKGEDDAPVKIVEYVDILCPYCAKVHEEVMPQIQSEYIDTGKVHFEVRMVAKIAPDSQRAAEGAYCAAEQNKFWDYLDHAYGETWGKHYSQNKGPEEVVLFSRASIQGFVRQAGIDDVTWQQCMDEGKSVGIIAANQQEMTRIKAYGTPHFVINGQNYSGAPPFNVFKTVIDAELNKAGAGS